MKDAHIVQTALQNLQNKLNIEGEWMQGGNPQNDGQLRLSIAGNTILFNLEIKQELRNQQLPAIFTQAQLAPPFMVMANKIFPAIKEELKNHNIAWIETNGNTFIQQDGVFIYVDGQKDTDNKPKPKRTFTKTGLKIIFQFLVKPHQLNYNQRRIAQIADVALGNVNLVFTDLKETGFLVELNKDERKLTNKKALLEKWVDAYIERLKPSIYLGTYRFVDPDQFFNYKDVQILGNETLWGGEPAGDLLTDHLRPEVLTMYTRESKAELMRKYRMIPDEDGNIEVYQKFWQLESTFEDIVPKVLVYADLITKNDKRCRETAQIIFEKYIEPDL